MRSTTRRSTFWPSSSISAGGSSSEAGSSGVTPASMLDVAPSRGVIAPADAPCHRVFMTLSATVTGTSAPRRERYEKRAGLHVLRLSGDDYETGYHRSVCATR